MCASYDPWLIEKMQKEDRLKEIAKMLGYDDLIDMKGNQYIHPPINSWSGKAELGGHMNVCLVDKSHKFNPSGFSSTVIARIEIEVSNEEELMNVLKQIQNMDPKALPSNSGLQPNPVIPPKLKTPVKNDDSQEKKLKDDSLFLGPIGTLEID